MSSRHLMKIGTGLLIRRTTVSSGFHVSMDTSSDHVLAEAAYPPRSQCSDLGVIQWEGSVVHYNMRLL